MAEPRGATMGMPRRCHFMQGDVTSFRAFRCSHDSTFLHVLTLRLHNDETFDFVALVAASRY